MGWQAKYWDIIEQLYWRPDYIGLKSINQKKWVHQEGVICVPIDMVNKSGPLYTRQHKAEELLNKLRRYEEVLNHVFDITFAIAPDNVIEEIFYEPLGFSDIGPFESVGREVRSRFSWGASENITQADGFYVSDRSIVATELKLKSFSDPLQIIKYAALFVLEEKYSGRKEQLGLLYIIPQNALSKHWSKCGLTTNQINADFLDQIERERLPKYIQVLLELEENSFRDVLDRIELQAISWSDLYRKIQEKIHGLDISNPGEQTLYKLLSGFLKSLEAHKDTGIEL